MAAASITVAGQARQRAGPMFLNGYLYEFVERSGPTPALWSISLASDNGHFRGGRLAVSASGFGCNDVECIGAEIATNASAARATKNCGCEPPGPPGIAVADGCGPPMGAAPAGGASIAAGRAARHDG
ncbi:MAG: hypothetical protein ACRDPR_12170 [Nocardioidaceae bacterium]